MLHMSYLELQHQTTSTQQQLWKLPESFLRGGPAWRGVPIRLELAEAVKRQAHHLTGYLRGQWAWVKMALIKMEWTCLGSCETLRGCGGGTGCARACICVHVCVYVLFFLYLRYHKAIAGCLDICVCLCVSVCGLYWKHVLAASCVNVRRTWGRSHYHPPHTPPLLTPPSCIYSQQPLASTNHFFFSLSFSLCLCLCLSLSLSW